MKIFKQDPSKSEKFKPDSALRQIESLEIDRKEDLDKFSNWMRGVSKETSDLPDKKELDKLNEEVTKGSGKGMGILGAVAALAGGGLAFGALGGMDGISSMVGDAMSFITGGVSTSTGSGTNILGLGNIQSLIPKMPDFSGITNAITGQPTAQSNQSNQSLPAVPASSTVVLAGGTNSYGNPKQAATEMSRAIKELQNKGYKVVVVPPDSESSQFSPVSNAVTAAAQAQGATIERGQYGGDSGNDRLHLTPDSADAIRQKYAGAIFMGDSNAARLAKDRGLQGVRREGALTSEILQQAQNLKALQSAPPQVQPQPLRSPATVTPTQSAVGGTGNVNQWLHGNPNRAGYDAGHAGSNAHDHFSFNSRASAVAAFKALKAAGYAPYEFEGYGDYTKHGMKEGSHSPGGGHFGPVGGTPTYNDLTDGTAFDIPWSSYGSGPITQSDYDKSYKAAQIVGAVDGGGNVTQTPSSQPPNYGEGRTEQQQQQQGPNLVQQLTKMFGPLTDMVMPYISSAFEAFKLMGDKEYMDSIHITGRDPETGLPTSKKPESLEYNIESILDMVESVSNDNEVSMLSPAAEAAAQGNVFFFQDNQSLLQSPALAPPQVSDSSGGMPRPSSDVLIAGGEGASHTYNRMLYSKIG